MTTASRGRCADRGEVVERRGRVDDHEVTRAHERAPSRQVVVEHRLVWQDIVCCPHQLHPEQPDDPQDHEKPIAAHPAGHRAREGKAESPVQMEDAVSPSAQTGELKRQEQQIHTQRDGVILRRT